MSTKVNINGRLIDTSTPEYKKLYPNLVENTYGDLQKTLPEVTITPRNNLNLGAVVHKGQNEFAKHYILPAGKIAASLNPVTAIPMAGMELYSAYNMPESENYGDKGQAWLNAGLEMLPFGISKAANKAVPFLRKQELVHSISKASKEFSNQTLPINGIPLNVGWGPAQKISVTHAANSDSPLKTLFSKRWDVVNGGANPHGIWFQGKFGVPRTDLTNPGKGTKAAKARKLFEDRPVHLQGNLDLKKPIVTVGDVPNRSKLSYDADKMGADAIIYNDIYDNGYNNNQVILSFKDLENKKLIKNIEEAHKNIPRATIKQDLNELKPLSIPQFLPNSVKGKIIAARDMKSEVINNTNLRNTELHNRAFGLKNSATPYEHRLKSTRILNKDSFSDNVRNLKTNANNANVGGYYNPKNQEIVLPKNTSVSSAYHENIHSWGYGSKPHSQWLTEKIMDPSKINNSKLKHYYSDPQEAATQSLELGKAWDLKLGQEFPGEKAFDELLESSKISGAPYYFKRDTLKDKKRFWKALTGQFFGTGVIKSIDKEE